MKTKQHTTVSTFSTLLNPTIFARQQQSQQSNLDLPSKKDVNTNELCKKTAKTALHPRNSGLVYGDFHSGLL